MITRTFKSQRGAFAMVELPTAKEETASQVHALGGFSPYYTATEEEQQAHKLKHPEALGPNVKKKMADLQQAKKYFDKLEDWQVEKYNRNTAQSMTVSNWESLFDAIIQNNVRDIYSLDDIDNGARSLILSTTRDINTFNALVATCHAIKKALPKGNKITRKLFIAERIKSVFKQSIQTIKM